MELNQKDKILVIFDFDNTVIDCNSDQVYWDLFPDQSKLKELTKQYSGYDEWTKLMNVLYQHLYKEHNIQIDQIKKSQQSDEVQLVIGVKELFEYFENNKDKFELIIASDSNTYFIDWILEKLNFPNLFSRVFTNHAREEKGLLVVDHHHVHQCEKCPPNICKKKVVKDFIEEQKGNNIIYSNILYMGDGGNDYCPLDQLGEKGIVFTRQGFSLEKKLQKENDDIKCQKVIWNSGLDILNTIQKLVQQ